MIIYSTWLLQKMETLRPMQPRPFPVVWCIMGNVIWFRCHKGHLVKQGCFLLTSTLLVLVGATELAHCTKLTLCSQSCQLTPKHYPSGHIIACSLGQIIHFAWEEDPKAAAAKGFRIRPFERLCEHHTTEQCERQAGNQPGLPAERAHRQAPCSAQPPASQPSHCSTAALSRCLRDRGNCYDLMHKVKK